MKSHTSPGVVGRSLSVEDELKGLELDGYKVTFVTKVVLLPVELQPVSEARNSLS